MTTSKEQRTTLLRNRAVSFSQSFLAHTPPPTILSTYFRPDSPQITEHGPEWARSRLPFLGRTFTGRDTSTPSTSSSPTTTPTNNDTCDEYFRLLSNTLEFIAEQSSFPSPEGFLVNVDVEGGDDDVVMVVGRGTFRSVRTGIEWKESFVHRLSRWDDGGRIGHWEIWADPLSAWCAVGPWDGPGPGQERGGEDGEGEDMGGGR